MKYATTKKSPQARTNLAATQFNLFANSSRRLSGRASYEYGDFFNGTRLRVSTEAVWRYNARLELEGTYEFNHINLPNGAFNTHLFGHRFLYSFSPDMFVRGFLQWNSAQELVGGNFLFNYRYLPGSDLFLVYNQVWDTEGGLATGQPLTAAQSVVLLAEVRLPLALHLIESRGIALLLQLFHRYLFLHPRI